MSALDQAFIKAFAKEPAATAERSMPQVAPRQALAPLAAEPPRFDELYDAGTFYRLDSATEERAVPATHLTPERKVPRRLQRRSAARAEFDIALPMQPEPLAEAPSIPVPPRRNWSRSMLEIARQLAQFDLLHKDDADVPPELVALDPPEVAQPSPVRETPPQAVSAQAPSAPAELKLPPSAPTAIAQLWTVHEPIVTQAVVAFTDAQSWLAQPMAPAVACHENVTEWAKATTKEAVASPGTEAATAAAPAEKKSRKIRVDGSHPRIPRPHRLPEVKPAIEEPATPIAEPVAKLAPTVASEPHAETPVEQVIETVPPPAPVAEASAVDANPVEATPEPVTVLSTTVPKRPYVPLWEVDRFTWPPLCDKLMHDPSGYFASASNKLLSVVRGGLKVLGVTGSRRGEGRTTLALCLARAAAQAGIHVALVDADFTRPQLATTLGLETAYGWQEAATGKIPLSEAAIKSLADRVTVLPLEVSTTEAPLSLADPRVTATLRATAATFELVIVDLGPLTSSNEALFPADENCPLDAAIVVRDTRYASVNESRLVGDRLYDAGIEAVGIAENFVTQPELAFL